MKNKVYFIASIVFPLLIIALYFLVGFTTYRFIMSALVLFVSGTLFGLSWCRAAYEKRGLEYVEKHFFQKSLK